MIQSSASNITSFYFKERSTVVGAIKVGSLFVYLQGTSKNNVQCCGKARRLLMDYTLSRVSFMATLSSARREPITATLYLESPLQKERLSITTLQMLHISHTHAPLTVTSESKAVLTNITSHPEYTYTERIRHTESNPRKDSLIMFWPEMLK